MLKGQAKLDYQRHYMRLRRDGKITSQAVIEELVVCEEKTGSELSEIVDK